jgi:hypothetical protein
MRRSISSLKNIEIPWSRLTSAFRRNGHGGNPWSRTSGLSQPQDQDDAIGTHARITEISARLYGRPTEAAGVVVMDEPEDAHITGGTRSLTRRLTGLNVIPRPGAKPVQRVAPAASQSQVA